VVPTSNRTSSYFADFTDYYVLSPHCWCSACTANVTRTKRQRVRIRLSLIQQELSLTASLAIFPGVILEMGIRRAMLLQR